jgi:hypothetical protein
MLAADIAVGKKVHCPVCSAIVLVPGVPAQNVLTVVPVVVPPSSGRPPEDDVTARPAGIPPPIPQPESAPPRQASPPAAWGTWERRDRRSSPWGVVQAGLWTALAGFLLCVLGSAVSTFAQMALVDARARDPASGSGLATLVAVGGWTVILGGIALIVGLGLSIPVPASTGARGFAIASLALFGLGAMFFLFAVVVAVEAMTLGGPPPHTLLVLSLLVGVCVLLSHLLFVFFLRAIGAALGRYRLARNCVVYAAVVIATAVADITFNALASRSQGEFVRGHPPGGLAARFSMTTNPGMVLFEIVLLLIGLVLLFAYAALTVDTNRAIRNRQRRPEGEPVQFVEFLD